MDIMSAEQENIDVLLTQMGAKVKSAHGLICKAKFVVNDTEIIYVYNVNDKEKYYLQKVLPYPVGVGEFTNPDEIVNFIEKDIASYKNAAKSSKFKDFVNVNKELNETLQDMEEVFLTFNVPHDKLDEVTRELDKIKATIAEIKKISNTIE